MGTASTIILINQHMHVTEYILLYVLLCDDTMTDPSLFMAQYSTLLSVLFNIMVVV